MMMALNSFLRRGRGRGRGCCGSLLPLGIGSWRFSTSIDQHFAGLLSSDFSNLQSSNMMPHNDDDQFPFKIEKNTARAVDVSKEYIIRRKYRNEIIQIAFDKLQAKGATPPAIPMTAYILRGGNEKLEFQMIAQPNQIHITSFVMSNYVHWYLNSTCFGKFLEMRGFNSILVDYLYQCLWKPKAPPLSAHPIFEEPGGCPFKFVDETDWKRGELYLERQFEDEMVKAHVYAPFGTSYENARDLFVMDAEIVHGDEHLTFRINFFPHTRPLIRLCHMSMRDDSGHLKAFQKFWEIRGLKPSTPSYLFDYFKKKDELKTWQKDWGVET